LKLPNPLPDGFEIEQEATDQTAAVVMKPKDVESFMRWVEANKPDAHVVSYALTFFAGIRPNGEATRLTWDNIRLDEPNGIGGHGIIRLDGVHTKTRSIRKIPVSDNLHAWLTRYKPEGEEKPKGKAKRKGMLSPAYSLLSTTRQEACKALGIDWHPDIARHTFATAAGSIHGFHAAAEWLGHGERLATFKRHYEGVLTHREAQAFFDIQPLPYAGAKIIHMEATA
jgi:integrase